MSAWFRTPRPGAATDSATMRVDWLNSLGVAVGSMASGDPKTSCAEIYYSWAGDWCFVYEVGVVPAGAVSARLSIGTKSGSVSRWYIDDATFGPTTTSPASAGSRLHQGTPPGSGSVDVDVTDVLRDIPRTNFGDGTAWRSSANAQNFDNPVVQDAIRNRSNPGVLRFGGGGLLEAYDWEHPTLSGPVGQIADLDSFMRFVRAAGVSEVLYTLNQEGAAPIFTVTYDGNAVTATMSVDESSLRVDLVSPTDGTANLAIEFAQFPTAGEVVDAVNAANGYSAALNFEDRSRDPLFEELVAASGVSVKAAPGQVRVNTGNVHKSERLVDYANNPSSTVLGPNGLTRDAALAAQGLPPGPYNIRYFEVGNETWLVGYETTLNPLGVARQVARYARAIRAVYQSFPIEIGASTVSFQQGEAGKDCCGKDGAQYVFNMVMAREAGPELDFIVEHVYQDNFRTTAGGVLAGPQHLQRIQNVRMLQEQFAAYSPDHRPDVPVYMTEYGVVAYAAFSPFGATNPNYQLSNGLFTADMLGVLLDQGVELTTHHVQLDFPFASNVVIDEGTRVATQASGLAMELYNRHFGTKLVSTTYRSPIYDIPQPDLTLRPQEDPGGSPSAYPYQTAYSSVSSDGSRLYVMLINKSGTDLTALGYSEQSIATQVNLNGFTPLPGAKTWTLTGASLSAFNLPVVTADLGVGYDANALRIDESTITNAADSFSYTTPPHSATVIELTRAP